VDLPSLRDEYQRTLRVELVENPLQDMKRWWPLWIEHRDELSTDKELMKVKPDVERYEELIEQGRVFSLALYRGDDLVGYSINFLTTSLHYSDVKFFQNDVLYLTPEERKGRAGLKLIKATEEIGKAVGAHMMLWHAKYDTNLEKILRRWEYKVQDIIFSKRL
jgi:hypothetical protein